MDGEKLSKLTVVQLRSQLKKRRLSTGGRKAELIGRLLAEEVSKEKEKEVVAEEPTTEKPEEPIEIPTVAKEDIDVQSPKEELAIEEPKQESNEDGMDVEKEEKKEEVEPADSAPIEPTAVENEVESSLKLKRPRVSEDKEESEPSRKIVRTAEWKPAEEVLPVAIEEDIEDVVEEVKEQVEEVEEKVPEEESGLEGAADKVEKEEETEIKTPEETTCALYVDNFLRPFRLPDAEAFLEEDGKAKFFKMDAVRSHAYVVYEDVEIAVKTYHRVQGKQWPLVHGKNLACKFVDPDSVQASTVVPEKQEKDAPNDSQGEQLDALFQKTEYQPSVFYSPLTEEQIKEGKTAASVPDPPARRSRERDDSNRRDRYRPRDDHDRRGRNDGSPRRERGNYREGRSDRDRDWRYRRNRSRSPQGGDRRDFRGRDGGYSRDGYSRRRDSRDRPERRYRR